MSETGRMPLGRNWVRNTSSMNEDRHLFDRIGASHYDVDADQLGRRYREAHAIQNEFICMTLREWQVKRSWIIDLGCGTGSDGYYILSRLAKSAYVGVDNSSQCSNRRD